MTQQFHSWAYAQEKKKKKNEKKNSNSKRHAPQCSLQHY